MAEGNPPTKGEDLDLNNELPVTGERKQFSKTAILLSSKWLHVLFGADFLDRLHLKVLGNKWNAGFPGNEKGKAN